MIDHTDGAVLSTKLKDFLMRKLEERRAVITKLKRKKKIVKVLYYSTTILSIIISTILAAISTSVAVPPLAILMLSMSSGILTAISTKFNLSKKSKVLNTEILKLNKLISKLDFVVSCNGSITSETYNEILLEFR